MKPGRILWQSFGVVSLQITSWRILSAWWEEERKRRCWTADNGDLHYWSRSDDPIDNSAGRILQFILLWICLSHSISCWYVLLLIQLSHHHISLKFFLTFTNSLMMEHSQSTFSFHQKENQKHTKNNININSCGHPMILNLTFALFCPFNCIIYRVLFSHCLSVSCGCAGRKSIGKRLVTFMRLKQKSRF